MKNSTGQVIKVLSVIYLVLIFFGGIILAEAFKVPSSGYSYYQSYDLNWSLAIGFWISGSVVSVVLFALSEVIFLLQGIKDKMPALEDEENHGSEESQEDDKKQENEENPDSEENEESKDSAENHAISVNNWY